MVAGAASNNGDKRATINTPAVTMVAAWISADTGVGPSMASGSQVWSRNWADLPMAPMNNNNVTIVMASQSAHRKWIEVSFAASTGPKSAIKIQMTKHDKGAKNTKGKTEIPDPVDDKGFHRRSVGGGFVIPKSDKQIGGKAHPFPTEEHLEEIIGGDQHQHGEGKQGQIGKKP